MTRARRLGLGRPGGSAAAERPAATPRKPRTTVDPDDELNAVGEQKLQQLVLERVALLDVLK